MAKSSPAIHPTPPLTIKAMTLVRCLVGTISTSMEHPTGSKIPPLKPSIPLQKIKNQKLVAKAETNAKENDTPAIDMSVKNRPSLFAIYPAVN